MAYNKALIIPDPVPFQYLATNTVIDSGDIDVSGAFSAGLFISWFVKDITYRHYGGMIHVFAKTSQDAPYVLVQLTGTGLKSRTGSFPVPALAGDTTANLTGVGPTVAPMWYVVDDADPAKREMVQVCKYHLGSGDPQTFLDPLQFPHAGATPLWQGMRHFLRINCYSYKTMKIVYDNRRWQTIGGADVTVPVFVEIAMILNSALT